MLRLLIIASVVAWPVIAVAIFGRDLDAPNEIGLIAGTTVLGGVVALILLSRLDPRPGTGRAAPWGNREGDSKRDGPQVRED